MSVEIEYPSVGLYNKFSIRKDKNMKKSKLTLVEQIRLANKLTSNTFNQKVSGTNLNLKQWLHLQLHQYRELHREACACYDYAIHRTKYKLNAMNGNAPSQFLDGLYLSCCREGKQLKNAYISSKKIKDIIRKLIKTANHYYSRKMTTQSTTKIIDVDLLVNIFNSCVMTATATSNAGYGADLIHEVATSMLSTAGGTTAEHGQITVKQTERLFRNCHIEQRQDNLCVVGSAGTVRFNLTKHKNCKYKCDGHNILVSFDLTATNIAIRELDKYIEVNRSISYQIARGADRKKMMGNETERVRNSISCFEKEYLKELIKKCFKGIDCKIAIDYLYNNKSAEFCRNTYACGSSKLTRIKNQLCNFTKSQISAESGKQEFKKIKKH